MVTWTSQQIQSVYVLKRGEVDATKWQVGVENGLLNFHLWGAKTLKRDLFVDQIHTTGQINLATSLSVKYIRSDRYRPEGLSRSLRKGSSSIDSLRLPSSRLLGILTGNIFICDSCKSYIKLAFPVQ